MKLELQNIGKSFGDLVIFRDFSVSFTVNGINCILGPSGCGKTSLLNMISGTLSPDTGSTGDFPQLSHSVVFQDPRLLPWKTAKENIAFVLKEKMHGEELDKKVNEYLGLMQLEGFGDYYPSKLSGGMKQRVALARAFSFKSDVILLDEPFKALDYKLKYSLIDQFLRLWETDRRTVIFVTHDVDEALHIGHRLFLFSQAPVQVRGQYEIPADSARRDTLRKELFEQLNGDGQ